MRVTINDRERLVLLSYDEVLVRAGMDPGRVLTVTWSSADGRFNGTLAPGQSVELTDGMRFSVSDTGKA